jgi:hypothetical protein
MRGPQDQLTDLDIALYINMNAKRVEVDNDALDLVQNSYQEVSDNIASPQSFVVLNANRRNPNGFKVTTDNTLSSQLFQQIQDAQRRIESVSGIYRAMLGQSTEAASGVAINNLVEQGSTVLAEPNDNFRYARRMVGEQLLELVKADLVGVPTQVSVKQGSKSKTIYFNQPTDQGTVNDIATAQVKVVLEDVPATPSFRQQQLQNFSQIVQTAPPEYQAVLYPVMLELSDVPNRHEVANQLRKVGNVPGPTTPEQEQQQAQAMQQQQAIQMKAVELELQTKQAQVEKLQAEAQKIQNDAQAQAQAAQAQQQQQAIQVQIEHMKAQIAQSELQLKSRGMDIEEEKAKVDATIKAETVNIAQQRQDLDEKTAAAALKTPGVKAENKTTS